MPHKEPLTCERLKTAKKLQVAPTPVTHLAATQEADLTINGARQDQYGAPENSFSILAGYWNVFLRAKLKKLGYDVPDLLTPLDTANMMVLFKQARKLGQKPCRDNYVDSIGYEAIGADRLLGWEER